MNRPGATGTSNYGWDSLSNCAPSLSGRVRKPSAAVRAAPLATECAAMREHHVRRIVRGGPAPRPVFGPLTSPD